MQMMCKKKKAFFPSFLNYFFDVFPYIWPLDGPNIAEKCWPLLGKAWERVWEGFGKLDFQAVIKSAASAASPTAWELHGSARGEAALAADLITA